MADQVKTAVIYYSATGSVHKLAQAVVEGAEKAGSEVRLRKVHELAPQEAINTNAGWSAHALETQNVPEATNDDLLWADVVIFGTPTRYGNVTAQLKQFLDGTGPLWGQGLLADKIYSGFTSTATAHGGQESTLLALYTTIHHFGGIVVSPGYTDPIQFAAGNPYGASHISNNGTVPPGETDLAAATYLATRAVKIATGFKAGRAAA